VASNLGGRSTFRNAGRTQRRGVELAWTARLAPAWRAQVAATWLEASFVDAFGTGADAVAAGNRVPGVPSRRAWAGLDWAPDPRRGPFAGVEVLHSGPIAVDERGGWRHVAGPWRLAAWVRVDNATDARHVGSVIVNEAQRRFFEPSAGRAWFAGASVSRAL
jgi:iron complex outermembrane receptor protein